MIKKGNNKEESVPDKIAREYMSDRDQHSQIATMVYSTIPRNLNGYSLIINYNYDDIFILEFNNFYNGVITFNFNKEIINSNSNKTIKFENNNLTLDINFLSTAQRINVIMNDNKDVNITFNQAAKYVS